MGIGKIPVINVENACASSATAFQQACTMVSLGAYDIVLACGVEKLFSDDKQKTFAVFSGGIDVEQEKRPATANNAKAGRSRCGRRHQWGGAGHAHYLSISMSPGRWIT